jgi:hypothetical protein
MQASKLKVGCEYAVKERYASSAFRARVEELTRAGGAYVSAAERTRVVVRELTLATGSPSTETRTVRAQDVVGPWEDYAKEVVERETKRQADTQSRLDNERRLTAALVAAGIAEGDIVRGRGWALAGRTEIDAAPLLQECRVTFRGSELLEMLERLVDVRAWLLPATHEGEQS